MRPSSTDVATKFIEKSRFARLRTKSEVADKANAALVLLDGIDLTGDDEKIVDKVQRILEDIVEMSEKSWL